MKAKEEKLLPVFKDTSGFFRIRLIGSSKSKLYEWSDPLPLTGIINEIKLSFFKTFIKNDENQTYYFAVFQYIYQYSNF